ncbi:restriction endonuclease [Myxococcus sp. AB025B]|uniref:restriction endonuclease n=1 Tax=Myxococcus sp. AB025B TaxID=2562794 RepID=UPI0018919599|nr:restriction endonuclease [Myxococcus sp. AB025B]
MSIANSISLDSVDEQIARLRQGDFERPSDAERILGGILEPLFLQEGYVLEPPDASRSQRIDFRARRASVDGAAELGGVIGVEAKFYSEGQKVTLASVEQLVGAALMYGFGRAILVSNRGFERGVVDAVSRALPLQVELLDLDGLQDWVGRLRVSKVDVEAEIRQVLREVSGVFARKIAASPEALAHLEWRDVERVMAEVFDGLGFEVKLTPGSKDGGKDVVLACNVRGRRAEYYVEIKHWRSATRVGRAAVERLLKVVAEEKKDGGVFLSTYGFTSNAFEQLTVIDRQRLRYGGTEKVVSICQTYVKARTGLWSPPENLAEILSFE